MIERDWDREPDWEHPLTCGECYGAEVGMIDLCPSGWVPTGRQGSGETADGEVG